MIRFLTYLCAATLVVSGCSKDPDTADPDAGSDMSTPEDMARADTGSNGGNDMPATNPSPCDPIAQDCIEPDASTCGVVMTEDTPAIRVEFACRASLGEVGLGESCTRPNGVVGEDDCAPGLYCGYWGLPAGDPQERVCQQLCQSNADCPAEGSRCHGIDAAGSIGFCTSPCDPRGDDCAAGTKCGLNFSSVNSEAQWYCDFDTEASVGTACARSEACGAGQACVAGSCQLFCADDLRCSDGGACAPIIDAPGWGFCQNVDWTCAGTAWPTPSVAESEVTVHVVDIDGFDDVEGAMVSACAIDDLDCATPVATGMTDVLGRVALLVPTGTDGFDGYFEITATGFEPFLVFARRPFGEATGETIALLSNAADTPFDGGLSVDDTRGQIITTLFPCNPDELAIDLGGGAQVSITSDIADVDTVTGYFSELDSNVAFDPALMSTTISGSAAMGNHPTGAATLTYTNSAGTVVATRAVIVRANVVSYVWAEPTP